MNIDLPRVCRLFRESRQSCATVALATVICTEGSTYRKAGARVLIDPKGRSSGILSGGCLEADLRERAAEVIASARPIRIMYDARASDDPIWGLGLGCEGAMEVWLQQAGPEFDYEPLNYFLRCWEEERNGAVATVVGGEVLPSELGQHFFLDVADERPLAANIRALEISRPSLRKVEFDGRMLEVFAAPVDLPLALLLCGAGPDAIPIAQFGVSLGWRVTVYDHREAYAVSNIFPESRRVILGRPEELTDRLDLSQFDAAVVMSHHLHSDVEYLRRLARRPPGYVGVLGPLARCKRLLTEAGSETSTAIEPHLHAPVGLDIGGNSPESIALAIVAEIHSVQTRRCCSK
ncbi:MAG TPA: XdhC family protein [Steroidobacteraceae bacterium]|nr:XdhC family protein [Steroidobacteraceae bacterium]